MSVMDKGIIDFIGIEENKQNLVLTVCDHLEWGKEADGVHLFLLQEKTNDYLQFIEGGQINEHFKSNDYDKIIMCKQLINDADFELEWIVYSTDDNS